MDCKRLEPDLSLCLDGRLPAGRRAAVLEHASTCAVCRRRWQELQEAQRLARSLPSLPVSPAFRSVLWERIRAGEGTPLPALADTTLPWTTKARYVLTGAAAAAALLVVLNAVRPASRAPQAAPVVAQESTVAEPSAPQPEQPVLAPRVAQQDGAAPAGLASDLLPMKPTYVAQTGALTAAASTRQLQGWLRRLDMRPREIDYTTAKRAIDEGAEEFVASAHLLRWMHERRVIELPDTMLEQLHRVESSVASLRSAQSVGEIAVALRPLEQVRPEALQDGFKVWCCNSEEQFADEIKQLVLQRPEVQRVFVLIPAPVHPFGLGGPGQQRFMIWREHSSGEVQMQIRIERRSR